MNSNLENNKTRESQLSLERRNAKQTVHYQTSKVCLFFSKKTNFLSSELEERIIKQYLKKYPNNGLYTSYETCNSFKSCID